MSRAESRPAVVRVDNAVKRYGDVTALDDFSIEILEGETVGLIGANGAGKTTLVESVMGARRLDSGEIAVLGLSPQRDRTAAATHMSLQPQGSSLYKYLTVAESVSLWASFYPNPAAVEEVVEAVGLQDKRNARVRTLSGGQHQRLRLALALVGNTDVVLLDEPTVGLDPAGRELVWDVIRQRAGRGAVLLATQMMDEAEVLCDRIVIMDQGRAVCSGPVDRLLSEFAHDGSVTFKTSRPVTTQQLKSLPGVVWSSARRIGEGSSVRLITMDQRATRSGVLSSIAADASMYRTSPPSLGDVFLRLIGSTPDSARKS